MVGSGINNLLLLICLNNTRLKVWISIFYDFSYHQLMKDENIESSGWSDAGTSLGNAREIKFLKPVNLPGLASTRAKKVSSFLLKYYPLLIVIPFILYNFID